MSLSTLSFIVFIASSALNCAIANKQREICDCVPLNICPEVNRFNKEDAKYFRTVLKCKDEGYVRCCPNNESVNSALRRSDDTANVILIDDVQSASVDMKDSLGEEELLSTTEVNDLTTLEPEAVPRSLESDLITTEANELITTEQPEMNTENSRFAKFIDEDVLVVYPNHINSSFNPKMSRKKERMELEHLFLIFPNGEIEAAMATSTSAPSSDESSVSIKPKRVVVKKRLIKKKTDSLEGAESQRSETVIEPKQMDIEEVKKRLSAMHKSRRKLPTVSTTTTEEPVEETTLKKRKKKIRYRQQKQTTISPVKPIVTSPTFKPREEKFNATTMKPNRKVIYDARGRTNFLRRPSSQQSNIDNDELIEPEVITTTTTPKPTTTTESIVNYVSLQTFFTTPTPIQVVKVAGQIDFEHKVMIETVYKTLSAIHSGVDIKFVEKMIESHKSRMKDIRKKPLTTTAPVDRPTRPYRGSATFRKPATAQPVQMEVTGMRTRNLSRTRNTAATQTTRKVTSKVPRTLMSQFNPFMNSNDLNEAVDMPPKQKPPGEFKASPLYGITMDKFNEFDGDTIEKIHETLRSPAKTQNGFFPVIVNGTPSTLF